MISKTLDRFWSRFRRLPLSAQVQAISSYKLFRKDPSHNSLCFKPLRGLSTPIYSVRVGRKWRALGVVRDDTVYWFWIGSHAEYDKIISQL